MLSNPSHETTKEVDGLTFSGFEDFCKSNDLNPGYSLHKASQATEVTGTRKYVATLFETLINEGSVSYLELLLKRLVDPNIEPLSENSFKPALSSIRKYLCYHRLYCYTPNVLEEFNGFCLIKDSQPSKEERYQMAYFLRERMKNYLIRAVDNELVNADTHFVNHKTQFGAMCIQFIDPNKFNESNTIKNTISYALIRFENDQSFLLQIKDLQQLEMLKAIIENDGYVDVNVIKNYQVNDLETMVNSLNTEFARNYPQNFAGEPTRLLSGTAGVPGYCLFGELERRNFFMAKILHGYFTDGESNLHYTMSEVFSHVAGVEFQPFMLGGQKYKLRVFGIQQKPELANRSPFAFRFEDGVVLYRLTATNEGNVSTSYFAFDATEGVLNAIKLLHRHGHGKLSLTTKELLQIVKEGIIGGENLSPAEMKPVIDNAMSRIVTPLKKIARTMRARGFFVVPSSMFNRERKLALPIPIKYNEDNYSPQGIIKMQLTKLFENSSYKKTSRLPTPDALIHRLYSEYIENPANEENSFKFQVAKDLWLSRQRKILQKISNVRSNSQGKLSPEVLDKVLDKAIKVSSLGKFNYSLRKYFALELMWTLKVQKLIRD